jgi:hypothetical protein
MYKLVDKGKRKSVPVHAVKAYRAAIILNLGTRWRRVVSFMPWSLIPWGKSPQYPNKQILS